MDRDRLGSGKRRRAGTGIVRMIVGDENETRRIAARLGRRARPGDLICLSGPLGAGKTTFVQGFAKAAGFAGSTASPTFGLLRQYPAKRFRIYHADFFRLKAEDLPNLGADEWLGDPTAVCLLEWPEVAERLLPADRLLIELAHRKDGGRTMLLRGLGPRSRDLAGACRR